jgi:hypothetical protein
MNNQFCFTILAGLAVLISNNGCHSFEPCDIREKDCQAAVFYEMLDLRGEQWDAWASPPEMSVISEQEYRARLERQENSSADSDTSLDSALKLLNLQSDDDNNGDSFIDSKVKNVLAFYSSSTKQISIIDHGNVNNKEESTVTLAHEIIHALQDRSLSLLDYKNSASTQDAYLAHKCMIEGEARLYEILLHLKIKNLSIGRVDWTKYFADSRNHINKQLIKSKFVLKDAFSSSVYAIGLEYMKPIYAKGGNPAIEAAFLSKPQSTAMLLYGQNGLSRPPLSCHKSVTPSDFKHVQAMTLGSIGLYAFSIKTIGAKSWELMTTWSDDRLNVYSLADNTTAVSWSIRLMNKAFIPTIEKITSEAGAQVISKDATNEIIILAAENAAALEKLRGSANTCDVP